MNAEEIYKRLEREIIFGLLRPRERLVEAELCRKLKISRTLLREVFRRLEGVGLITFNPHKGAMVRDFTAKDIEDVYFVRINLEKIAAPLIINNINKEILIELKALNRRFEEACQKHDIEAMIFTNLSFHSRLAQTSGNPFLCRFLEVSRLQTHQARYISWLDKKRVKESLKDHKEMISALVNRDLPKFEAVTLRHQEAGKKDYQKIFCHQNADDYLSLNRKFGSK